MADFTKIRLIDEYLSSVSGSINVTGSIRATSFISDDGSGITNLATTGSNTFNGNQLIIGEISASLFNGNGSGLTLIDASQLDFSNVPISSSGLPTGSVYIEDGVLKIVESVN
jgi:hypothetical protein